MFYNIFNSTLCHFNTKKCLEFLWIDQGGRGYPFETQRTFAREYILYLLCKVATFVVQFICQLCVCVCVYRLACTVRLDGQRGRGIAFRRKTLYKMPDKAQSIAVTVAPLPMKIESNARLQLLPCLTNFIMPYGSTVQLNLLTIGSTHCRCRCCCPSCCCCCRCLVRVV